MGINSADALVLRRYPFRETSVIVTCLTEHFGKIKGLVKGLRGKTTRQRSAMEPLTINRIVFYDTRTSQLHLITQCELLDSLSALQRDLDTAQAAALFTDTTDAIAPLEEPHQGIYRLLKEALARLALGTNSLAAVRAHFLARLLFLSGFKPQADECTGCGQRVHEKAFWSVRNGGFLCPACLHEDPGAEPASASLLGALEALSFAPVPPKIDAGILPILNTRLSEFMRWRLEKPLKTLVR